MSAITRTDKHHGSGRSVEGLDGRSQRFTGSSRAATEREHSAAGSSDSSLYYEPTPNNCDMRRNRLTVYPGKLISIRAFVPSWSTYCCTFDSSNSGRRQSIQFHLHDLQDSAFKFKRNRSKMLTCYRVD